MKRRLVFNTALLTASSLLMSGIGMVFQVWLVGKIGSAGIGLYQLVISVTNLCATFAISGIRFASTRLVAEELGLEHRVGVGEAMRRCLAYGAFFGVAAGLILRALAEPVGFLWIGDARTVRPLRMTAWSMPCISVAASCSGYFTACGRVWKPTLIHLVEELSCMGLTALFLGRVPPGNIEQSCAAVTLARVGADGINLVLMLLAYALDRRAHYAEGEGGARLTPRMLRIAVPLALSAYARSALTTFQHLLVPRGLRAAGFSANSALSGYGTIQGMVLPILFFPACIMAAVSELIVPELTAAQVQGDAAAIRRTVQKLLRLSLLFSAAVGLFLFLCADALGLLVYESRSAGRYLRILAPLVPVIYTDMAVDGCLKGLGEQVWCMGINILDGLLGLLLTWRLLPRYALAAYLAIFYATELFNFLLSAARLLKITKRLSPPAAGGGAHPRDAGSAKCAYTAGRSAASPPCP